MVKVLLIELAHVGFRQSTRTDQVSGLSNCIRYIADAVPGCLRVVVYSEQQAISAIQRHSPKKVVFEALWASAGLIEATKRMGVKPYVHLHSNIPFLVAEGQAFHSIRAYKWLGVKLILNCQPALQALHDICEALFLPNVYPSDFKDRIKHNGSHLAIGCHGSVRPMKNQVVQALAAIKYANHLGKKLNFHMNLGRNEVGSSVLSCLRGLFLMNPEHTLVSDPWMSRDKFIEHCRSLDMGMQVSLSESFNLVAADYVAAGIPIVVSPEVRWSSLSSRANPSSVEEIFSTMKAAAEYSYEQLRENRYALDSHSDLAITMWSNFSNEA